MEEVNSIKCKAWIASWKQQAQIVADEIYYNRNMTTPRLIESSEEMLRIITKIMDLGYRPVFSQAGDFADDYHIRLAVYNTARELFSEEIVRPAVYVIHPVI